MQECGRRRSSAIQLGDEQQGGEIEAEGWCGSTWSDQLAETTCEDGFCLHYDEGSTCSRCASVSVSCILAELEAAAWFEVE